MTAGGGKGGKLIIRGLEAAPVLPERYVSHSDTTSASRPFKNLHARHGLACVRARSR